MNNPFILPNVSLHTKDGTPHPVPLQQISFSYEISLVHELLWELASNKPQWQFKIAKGGVFALNEPRGELTHYCVVKAVHIWQDREPLGTFSSEYHGSTRKLAIANARIAEGRTNRNGGKLITGDVKKAVREITKNFYPQRPNEQVTLALGALAKEMSSVYRRISLTETEAQSAFNSSAANFLRANVEILYGHQGADVHKDKALEAIEKLKSVEHNKVVYNAVGEPLKTLMAEFTVRSVDKPVFKDAALIISHGSTYILLYNGETRAIPSEELPDELRAPLGMLKLSEPDQIVEGVGFYTNNIYLVLPTKGDNDAA